MSSSTFSIYDAEYAAPCICCHCFPPALPAPLNFSSQTSPSTSAIPTSSAPSRLPFHHQDAFLSKFPLECQVKAPLYTGPLITPSTPAQSSISPLQPSTPRISTTSSQHHVFCNCETCSTTTVFSVITKPNVIKSSSLQRPSSTTNPTDQSTLTHEVTTQLNPQINRPLSVPLSHNTPPNPAQSTLLPKEHHYHHNFLCIHGAGFSGASFLSLWHHITAQLNQHNAKMEAQYQTQCSKYEALQRQHMCKDGELEKDKEKPHLSHQNSNPPNPHAVLSSLPKTPTPTRTKPTLQLDNSDNSSQSSHSTTRNSTSTTHSISVHNTADPTPLLNISPPKPPLKPIYHLFAPDSRGHGANLTSLHTVPSIPHQTPGPFHSSHNYQTSNRIRSANPTVHTFPNTPSPGSELTSNTPPNVQLTSSPDAPVSAQIASIPPNPSHTPLITLTMPKSQSNSMTQSNPTSFPNHSSLLLPPSIPAIPQHLASFRTLPNFVQTIDQLANSQYQGLSPHIAILDMLSILSTLPLATTTGESSFGPGKELQQCDNAPPFVQKSSTASFDDHARTSLSQSTEKTNMMNAKDQHSLDSKTTLTLLGHSLGGLVAVHLAVMLAHIQQLSQFIGINGSVSSGLTLDYNFLYSLTFGNRFHFNVLLLLLYQHTQIVQYNKSILQMSYRPESNGSIPTNSLADPPSVIHAHSLPPNSTSTRPVNNSSASFNPKSASKHFHRLPSLSTLASIDANSMPQPSNQSPPSTPPHQIQNSNQLSNLPAQFPSLPHFQLNNPSLFPSHQSNSLLAHSPPDNSLRPQTSILSRLIQRNITILGVITIGTIQQPLLTLAQFCPPPPQPLSMHLSASLLSSTPSHGSSTNRPSTTQAVVTLQADSQHLPLHHHHPQQKQPQDKELKTLTPTISIQDSSLPSYSNQSTDPTQPPLPKGSSIDHHRQSDYQPKKPSPHDSLPTNTSPSWAELFQDQHKFTHSGGYESFEKVPLFDDLDPPPLSYSSEQCLSISSNMSNVMAISNSTVNTNAPSNHTTGSLSNHKPRGSQQQPQQQPQQHSTHGEQLFSDKGKQSGTMSKTHHQQHIQNTQQNQQTGPIIPLSLTSHVSKTHDKTTSRKIITHHQTLPYPHQNHSQNPLQAQTMVADGSDHQHQHLHLGKHFPSLPILHPHHHHHHSTPHTPAETPHVNSYQTPTVSGSFSHIRLDQFHPSKHTQQEMEQSQTNHISGNFESIEGLETIAGSSEPSNQISFSMSHADMASYSASHPTQELTQDPAPRVHSGQQPAIAQTYGLVRDGSANTNTSSQPPQNCPQLLNARHSQPLLSRHIGASFGSTSSSMHDQPLQQTNQSRIESFFPPTSQANFGSSSLSNHHPYQPHHSRHQSRDQLPDDPFHETKHNSNPQLLHSIRQSDDQHALPVKTTTTTHTSNCNPAQSKGQSQKRSQLRDISHTGSKPDDTSGDEGSEVANTPLPIITQTLSQPYTPLASHPLPQSSTHFDQSKNVANFDNLRESVRDKSEPDSATPTPSHYSPSSPHSPLNSPCNDNQIIQTDQQQSTNRNQFVNRSRQNSLDSKSSETNNIILSSIHHSRHNSFNGKSNNDNGAANPTHAHRHKRNPSRPDSIRQLTTLLELPNLPNYQHLSYHHPDASSPPNHTALTTAGDHNAAQNYKYQPSTTTEQPRNSRSFSTSVHNKSSIVNHLSVADKHQKQLTSNGPHIDTTFFPDDHRNNITIINTTTPQHNSQSDQQTDTISGQDEEPPGYLPSPPNSQSTSQASVLSSGHISSAFSVTDHSTSLSRSHSHSPPQFLSPITQIPHAHYDSTTASNKPTKQFDTPTNCNSNSKPLRLSSKSPAQGLELPSGTVPSAGNLPTGLSSQLPTIHHKQLHSQRQSSVYTFQHSFNPSEIPSPPPPPPQLQLQPHELNITSSHSKSTDIELVRSSSSDSQYVSPASSSHFRPSQPLTPSPFSSASRDLSRDSGFVLPTRVSTPGENKLRESSHSQLLKQVFDGSTPIANPNASAPIIVMPKVSVIHSTTSSPAHTKQLKPGSQNPISPSHRFVAQISPLVLESDIPIEEIERLVDQSRNTPRRRISAAPIPSPAHNKFFTHRRSMDRQLIDSKRNEQQSISSHRLSHELSSQLEHHQETHQDAVHRSSVLRLSDHGRMNDPISTTNVDFNDISSLDHQELAPYEQSLHGVTINFLATHKPHHIHHPYIQHQHHQQHQQQQQEQDPHDKALFISSQANQRRSSFALSSSDVTGPEKNHDKTANEQLFNIDLDLVRTIDSSYAVQSPYDPTQLNHPKGFMNGIHAVSDLNGEDLLLSDRQLHSLQHTGKPSVQSPHEKLPAVFNLNLAQNADYILTFSASDVDRQSHELHELDSDSEDHDLSELGGTYAASQIDPNFREMMSAVHIKIDPEVRNGDYSYHQLISPSYKHQTPQRTHGNRTVIGGSVQNIPSSETYLRSRQLLEHAPSYNPSKNDPISNSKITIQRANKVLTIGQRPAHLTRNNTPFSFDHNSNDSTSLSDRSNEILDFVRHQTSDDSDEVPVTSQFPTPRPKNNTNEPISSHFSQSQSGTSKHVLNMSNGNNPLPYMAQTPNHSTSAQYRPFSPQLNSTLNTDIEGGPDAKKQQQQSRLTRSPSKTPKILSNQTVDLLIPPGSHAGSIAIDGTKDDANHILNTTLLSKNTKGDMEAEYQYAAEHERFDDIDGFEAYLVDNLDGAQTTADSYRPWNPSRGTGRGKGKTNRGRAPTINDAHSVTNEYGYDIDTLRIAANTRNNVVEVDSIDSDFNEYDPTNLKLQLNKSNQVGHFGHSTAVNKFTDQRFDSLSVFVPERADRNDSQSKLHQISKSPSPISPHSSLIPPVLNQHVSQHSSHSQASSKNRSQSLQPRQSIYSQSRPSSGSRASSRHRKRASSSDSRNNRSNRSRSHSEEPPNNTNTTNQLNQVIAQFSIPTNDTKSHLQFLVPPNLAKEPSTKSIRSSGSDKLPTPAPQPEAANIVNSRQSPHKSPRQTQRAQQMHTISRHIHLHPNIHSPSHHLNGNSNHNNPNEVMSMSLTQHIIKPTPNTSSFKVGPNITANYHHGAGNSDQINHLNSVNTDGQLGNADFIVQYGHITHDDIATIDRTASSHLTVNTMNETDDDDVINAPIDDDFLNNIVQYHTKNQLDKTGQNQPHGQGQSYPENLNLDPPGGSIRDLGFSPANITHHNQQGKRRSTLDHGHLPPHLLAKKFDTDGKLIPKGSLHFNKNDGPDGNFNVIHPMLDRHGSSSSSSYYPNPSNPSSPHHPAHISNSIPKSPRELALSLPQQPQQPTHLQPQNQQLQGNNMTEKTPTKLPQQHVSALPAAQFEQKCDMCFDIIKSTATTPSNSTTSSEQPFKLSNHPSTPSRAENFASPITPTIPVLNHNNHNHNHNHSNNTNNNNVHHTNNSNKDLSSFHAPSHSPLPHTPSHTPSIHSMSLSNHYHQKHANPNPTKHFPTSQHPQQQINPATPQGSIATQSIRSQSSQNVTLPSHNLDKSAQQSHPSNNHATPTTSTSQLHLTRTNSPSFNTTTIATTTTTDTITSPSYLDHRLPSAGSSTTSSHENSLASLHSASHHPQRPSNQIPQSHTPTHDTHLHYSHSPLNTTTNMQLPPTSQPLRFDPASFIDAKKHLGQPVSNPAGPSSYFANHNTNSASITHTKDSLMTTFSAASSTASSSTMSMSNAAGQGPLSGHQHQHQQPPHPQTGLLQPNFLAKGPYPTASTANLTSHKSSSTMKPVPRSSALSIVASSVHTTSNGAENTSQSMTKDQSIPPLHPCAITNTPSNTSASVTSGHVSHHPYTLPAQHLQAAFPVPYPIHDTMSSSLSNHSISITNQHLHHIVAPNPAVGQKLSLSNHRPNQSTSQAFHYPASASTQFANNNPTHLPVDPATFPAQTTSNQNNPTNIHPIQQTQPSSSSLTAIPPISQRRASLFTETLPQQQQQQQPNIPVSQTPSVFLSSAHRTSNQPQDQSPRSSRARQHESNATRPERSSSQRPTTRMTTPSHFSGAPFNLNPPNTNVGHNPIQTPSFNAKDRNSFNNLSNHPYHLGDNSFSASLSAQGGEIDGKMHSISQPDQFEQATSTSSSNTKRSTPHQFNAATATSQSDQQHEPQSPSQSALSNSNGIIYTTTRGYQRPMNRQLSSGQDSQQSNPSSSKLLTNDDKSDVSESDKHDRLSLNNKSTSTTTSTTAGTSTATSITAIGPSTISTLQNPPSMSSLSSHRKTTNTNPHQLSSDQINPSEAGAPMLAGLASPASIKPSTQQTLTTTIASRPLHNDQSMSLHGIPTTHPPNANPLRTTINQPLHNQMYSPATSSLSYRSNAPTLSFHTSTAQTVGHVANNIPNDLFGDDIHPAAVFSLNPSQPAFKTPQRANNMDQIQLPFPKQAFNPAQGPAQSQTILNTFRTSGHAYYQNQIQAPNTHRQQMNPLHSNNNLNIPQNPANPTNYANTQTNPRPQSPFIQPLHPATNHINSINQNNNVFDIDEISSVHSSSSGLSSHYQSSTQQQQQQGTASQFQPQQLLRLPSARRPSYAYTASATTPQQTSSLFPRNIDPQERCQTLMSKSPKVNSIGQPLYSNQFANQPQSQLYLHETTTMYNNNYNQIPAATQDDCVLFTSLLYQRQTDLRNFPFFKFFPPNIPTTQTNNENQNAAQASDANQANSRPPLSTYYCGQVQLSSTDPTVDSPHEINVEIQHDPNSAHIAASVDGMNLIDSLSFTITPSAITPARPTQHNSNAATHNPQPLSIDMTQALSLANASAELYEQIPTHITQSRQIGAEMMFPDSFPTLESNPHNVQPSRIANSAFGPPRQTTIENKSLIQLVTAQDQTLSAPSTIPLSSHHPPQLRPYASIPPPKSLLQITMDPLLFNNSQTLLTTAFYTLFIPHITRRPSFFISPGDVGNYLRESKMIKSAARAPHLATFQCIFLPLSLLFHTPVRSSSPTHQTSKSPQIRSNLPSRPISPTNSNSESQFCEPNNLINLTESGNMFMMNKDSSLFQSINSSGDHARLTTMSLTMDPARNPTTTWDPLISTAISTDHQHFGFHSTSTSVPTPLQSTNQPQSIVSAQLPSQIQAHQLASQHSQQSLQLYLSQTSQSDELQLTSSIGSHYSQSIKPPPQHQHQQQPQQHKHTSIMANGDDFDTLSLFSTAHSVSNSITTTVAPSTNTNKGPISSTLSMHNYTAPVQPNNQIAFSSSLIFTSVRPSPLRTTADLFNDVDQDHAVPSSINQPLDGIPGQDQLLQHLYKSLTTTSFASSQMTPQLSQLESKYAHLIQNVANNATKAAFQAQSVNITGTYVWRIPLSVQLSYAAIFYSQYIITVYSFLILNQARMHQSIDRLKLHQQRLSNRQQQQQQQFNAFVQYDPNERSSWNQTLQSPLPIQSPSIPTVNIDEIDHDKQLHLKRTPPPPTPSLSSNSLTSPTISATLSSLHTPNLAQHIPLTQPSCLPTRASPNQPIQHIQTPTTMLVLNNDLADLDPDLVQLAKLSLPGEPFCQYVQIQQIGEKSSHCMHLDNSEHTSEIINQYVYQHLLFFDALVRFDE